MIGLVEDLLLQMSKKWIDRLALSRNDQLLIEQFLTLNYLH